MQISGAIDFFSQITSWNRSTDTQNKTYLPTQAAARLQAGGDSLSLSEDGRELSLNVKKAHTVTENQKADANDKAEIKDPLLRIADKSMSLANDILEEMRELAITAQDESLDDLSRVNLQIEMEELRERLVPIQNSMWSQEQGGPPIARLSKTYPLGENDGTSLLERMKERITNGQEWNVREAWNDGAESSMVEYNDDGEAVMRFFDEGWYVVDDRNVLTTREGETVDTGQSVPTVREILDSETPVVLMDAESAAAGVKHLEQKIESVQKWRDRIAGLDDSQQSNGADAAKTSFLQVFSQAADFISKIDEQVVYDERRSLNRVTSAGYFVSGDVVHDFRYEQEMLVAGNVSDLSFGDVSFYETDGTESETEKINDKTASIFDVYGGTRVLLSEEILTSNANLIDPVHIYIPPVLGHFFNQVA